MKKEDFDYYTAAAERQFYDVKDEGTKKAAISEYVSMTKDLNDVISSALSIAYSEIQAVGTARFPERLKETTKHTEHEIAVIQKAIDAIMLTMHHADSKVRRAIEETLQVSVAAIGIYMDAVSTLRSRVASGTIETSLS
jgi:hypothetical protein